MGHIVQRLVRNAIMQAVNHLQTLHPGGQYIKMVM